MRSIDEIKISENLINNNIRFDDIVKQGRLFEQLNADEIILTDDELYAMIHYIYGAKNNIQDIFILTNLLLKYFESSHDLSINIIALADSDFVKNLTVRYLSYKKISIFRDLKEFIDKNNIKIEVVTKDELEKTFKGMNNE